jgi:hypothetical protein
MTNKFNKIVSALVLCGVTTFASASELQIDPTHTPSGTLTTLFSSLTGDAISPTSAYFDLDNSGISTGDLVFDSAFGEQFGSLNPTGTDLGLNIVSPTGWTLFADYEFYGAAIVNDGSFDSDNDGFAEADLNKDGTIGQAWVDGSGDVAAAALVAILSPAQLGAAGFTLQNESDAYAGGNADGVLDSGEQLAATFVGGYINVFLNTPYTASETDGAFDDNGFAGVGSRTVGGDTLLAMHFDVTGSSLAPTANSIDIQVFSELTSVIDDFIYSPNVGDIKDYIDVPTNHAYGTLSGEITNLSNEPTVDATYVISDLQNGILSAQANYDPQTLQVRTRTTTITSPNLAIDVPEPGSIALFGLALIGFAGAARRKLS